MNRGGLPEMMMLHCLKTSGGVSISKGAELNVLERQRSSGKWQQQPQQQGSAYSNVYTASAQGGDDQFRGQLCRDAGLQQVMVKPESGLDIAWTGFGNYGMPIVEDLGGFLDDSSYRMTKSCSLVSAVGESNEGKDSILTERANLGGAMESCKKRKAEMASTKEMKKMKEWAEDGESKVTSTNNKGKNKAGDASKVSEVKKTEYIHVRARRGQATDSHSLAERASINIH